MENKKTDRKLKNMFIKASADKWVEFVKLTGCDPLDSPREVMASIVSKLSIIDDND